jgi:hypothetical protein
LALNRRYLMRNHALVLSAFVVAWVLLPISASAHHSFAAQYDVNKPITIEGTVTKVEWMSPHVYFYVDVEGEDGNVVNYGVENGAPTFLYRRGWAPDTLKTGDRVTVEGSLARDGSPLVNASIVNKNGQRLFAGSSNPNDPNN